MTGFDIVAMLEGMAEHGTAPADGCHLFGVGYEQDFERLKRTYLDRRLGGGGSAEKFVIGPFGSGKTHFCHELMEIARDMDCATAEVQLNKDLDFTQNLLIYQEVARQIRTPGEQGRGISNLLSTAAARVRKKAPTGSASDRIIEAWVAALDKADFESELFARMLQRALRAHVRGEVELFADVCRWLSGEVRDPHLARQLSVSPVAGDERKRYGRLAMLSLFQFVRYSGFLGTVVTFDEAEQGFDQDKKTEARIHSLLQSDINAVTSLKNGSVLVIYALTPEIVDKMRKFPALDQRIADPAVDQGFFDGNTLAPRIDLTRRRDPLAHLQAMGHRLVDLLYQQEATKLRITKAEATERVDQIAQDITGTNMTSGNRREMVKAACTMLIQLLEDGSGSDARSGSTFAGEDEV